MYNFPIISNLVLFISSITVDNQESTVLFIWDFGWDLKNKDYIQVNTVQRTTHVQETKLYPIISNFLIRV
jgi:hypothetical protein